MTIEEAKEILFDLSWSDDIDGWVLTDREHKAICLASEALDNQPKYEEALEMAVRDSDETGTDVWCHDCPYDDDSKLEHCWECGAEYYKRKAGIEVDDEH